jgi:hypothetical protein
VAVVVVVAVVAVVAVVTGVVIVTVVAVVAGPAATTATGGGAPARASWTEWARAPGCAAEGPAEAAGTAVPAESAAVFSAMLEPAAPLVVPNSHQGLLDQRYDIRRL